MKWAIYTYLALQLIGLGYALASHGEERRYSFWSALTGVAINLYLLYKGGLFDNL